MGVEFRVGRNDVKPIEDFLGRRSDGVTAVSLDTKAGTTHFHAAGAAREANVAVYWEPGTERLASVGYNHGQHPLWQGAPFTPAAIAASADDSNRLVAATVSAHPDGVTHVTAPHFFVNEAMTAQLNVALAERTHKIQPAKPTRAILTISARNAIQLVDELDLAAQYARVGVEAIEIRLSPFGGEDVSLSRIRNAYAVLDKFRSHGMRVTVGHCGTIGLVAVALGHADAHSVGVGYLEKVDHSAAISRQARPPAAHAERRGPTAGVYLAPIAATVPRKLAAMLLENRDIRSRLACRTGACRNSILEPVDSARTHYVHSRAAEMASLLARPREWRATLETNRLAERLQLRERVNEHCLPSGASKIETRTLRSLLDLFVDRQQAAS
ncbi:conserved hypothetical protein [uncultured Mycobacterium sp.]|uniref:Uncharacterized protein n=1 Tax=uncultured Mycobacterium sp. TaxID=171292 RepID=A0A1Y5PL52_9MYCO|nr:conserved hypothetical protein [uncultured Mycobacterium sp.]